MGEGDGGRSAGLTIFKRHRRLAQLVEAEGVGHLFRQFPGTVAVRLANDLRVPREVLRIVEEFHPLGRLHRRPIGGIERVSAGGDSDAGVVVVVSRP